MEPYKRLYRSSRSKVFGGVAGGIADYFDIDPIIIRLLFVVITFAGGGGAIIYLILWIALPQEPITTPFGFNTNTGGTNPETPPFFNQNQDNPIGNFPKNKNTGGLIAGVILILVGFIFLAHRFLPIFTFHTFWPLVLIAIGAILLISVFAEHKQDKDNNLP